MNSNHTGSGKNTGTSGGSMVITGRVHNPNSRESSKLTKTEPLLIVFDNGYSLRTTKTVDVSVQVMKGTGTTAGPGVCRFCQAKIDEGVAFCSHCGGKQ